MVRGVVNLPNGSGRSVRVAVFATGEAAQPARDAGAERAAQLRERHLLAEPDRDVVDAHGGVGDVQRADDLGQHLQAALLLGQLRHHRLGLGDRADPVRLADQRLDLLVVARERVGALRPGFKYCLKIPGTLGGEYGGDNLGTISLGELISVSGDIAQQIKDLPDGAKIRLSIVD